MLKYLIVMHCDEDGYWDTSGHCHWSKPEFFRESEFDLDEKEDLIKAIANFKFEYPKGDVSVYKIEKMTWDESNDIIKEADPLIKDLCLEKEREDRRRVAIAQEDAAKRQKAYDLEQLRKLQEKYKGEI